MKKISELKVWKMNVTKPMGAQEVEYIYSSINLLAMKEAGDIYIELCRIDTRKDYSMVYFLCEEDSLKYIHKIMQSRLPNITYKIEESSSMELHSLP